jgi:hypothetical protein
MKNKYVIAFTLLIILPAAVSAEGKVIPAKYRHVTDQCEQPEIPVTTYSLPILGGTRQVPGDSVGTTTFDVQSQGSAGHRLYIDRAGGIHVDWTKGIMPLSGTTRRCEWNFRRTDGSYFGEVDAGPYGSAYVALDITRDANPADQRTVICYHYNTGTNAYYPFIDIDSSNGAGAYPYNPKTPAMNNYLWPNIACVNNGNILLATDDNAGNNHHVFLTTDEGNTWTNVHNSDSCATISQFIAASDNPGSNKVVYCETRYKTDSAAAGQLDNNVWFRLSTDGGVTWGQHRQITHYQSGDSVRAYCDVCAVFDADDNLHIAWSGRRISSGNYYDASKIFHWDEVSGSISVINGPNPIFEGGWWGWVNPNGYGAWRLPADRPALVVDQTTNWLYCIWCGQTDTSDYSAPGSPYGGYPNGDIYGAYSMDNGLTWDAVGTPYGYVNLTNTHTPGAPPGFCDDEDYMTANPFVYRDSIFITFIEDKDAGSVR